MIEVEIEDPAWTEALPDAEVLVDRAARAALGPTAGDVVVLLTNDAAVHEINARFRDRDQPTNVLSFPAAESAAPHLGDLMLAFGVCAVEAGDQGKSLGDHLTHLVVHGVLHLRGRDHEDEAEAEAMEAEERSLLASLGVADPYRLHDPADSDA